MEILFGHVAWLVSLLLSAVALLFLRLLPPLLAVLPVPVCSLEPVRCAPPSFTSIKTVTQKLE